MKAKLITLPNIITLANLLCGTLGIISMVSLQSAGALRVAFVLMLAAALFDFLDGFVARLTGQYSPVGAQLDSLADMVSSGVAPTAVMLTLAWQAGSSWWAADTGGPWSWIVLLLAVGTALRLAKFNIDDTQRTEFCGLPSPAAAMLCASLGMLAECYGLTLLRETVLAVAVVVGLLMISDVRMFALKFHGFGWKGNELRYGFIIAAVVTAVLLRGYAVPAIIVLYILVSLVRGLACRTKGCGKAE